MDNIISNTELCVLQYFWKSNEPQSFSQIFEYFNTTGGKDWKKQTLNTFLLRLTKKGYLKKEYQNSIILLDRYTTSSLIYQSALIDDIEKRKEFIYLERL